MNYHFTTTKAHITRNGGTVHEVTIDDVLDVDSTPAVQRKHRYLQIAGSY